MQAHFFDLDGVLTDSRPGLFASFRGALQALKLPDQTDEQLNRFLGTPLPEMFRVFKPDIAPAAIDTGIAAFRRVYEASGIRANERYPGVLELLRAIRQRRRKAWIVTSKPEKYAIEVARILGIDTLLDGIVGAGLAENDTKTGLIQTALARANVASDAVIMLGDRHYDITGAIDNHVLPVGALWGYGTRDELANAGCKHFVASVHEFQARFVDAGHGTTGGIR